LTTIVLHIVQKEIHHNRTYKIKTCYHTAFQYCTSSATVTFTSEVHMAIILILFIYEIKQLKGEVAS